MIRWRIVGVGWVARDFVIPAIHAARNAELVAALDIRDDPGDRTTADFDAVYIATPNDCHADIAAHYAAKGKHVLCEKPMARTLTEAQQMVSACRAAGVQYATAFDQRFHPRHRQMRDLIKNGKLGTICSARIHYACWLPPDWSTDNWRVDPLRAGGGAMIDLAPHGLDLLQVLLGEPIVAIHALKQRKLWNYPVDDGAVLTACFQGGALATIQVGYNCPDAFPRRRLEVIGSEGMLIANNTMGQTPGGTVHWYGADGQASELPPPFDVERSPFQLQIEAFSQSLLDRSPFPFTPEHDLETMRLLDQCR